MEVHLMTTNWSRDKRGGGAVIKAGLEDLYRELWLRLRNSGKLVWKSNSGDIPIKDMTNEYLKNAIRAEEQHKIQLDCWADFEANHSDWGDRGA